MNKPEILATRAQGILVRSIFLLFCITGSLFLGGCVIGVEPLDDAPLSHDNPDYDTAERMYEPPAQEDRETNREIGKDWDAGGKPLPKGGYDPFWPY